MSDVPKAIQVTVDEIPVKEVFQLRDGRMEIRWDPVDKVIPEELEYLAKCCEMNKGRTEREIVNQPDPVEYVLTRDGYWAGLRCPQAVWSLFMKSKGFSQEAVDDFMKAWANSPIKGLIDKALFDRTVQEVAKAKPWEKGK